MKKSELIELIVEDMKEDYANYEEWIWEEIIPRGLSTYSKESLENISGVSFVPPHIYHVKEE
jgi:hypothetical protein